MNKKEKWTRVIFTRLTQEVPQTMEHHARKEELYLNGFGPDFGHRQGSPAQQWMMIIRPPDSGSRNGYVDESKPSFSPAVGVVSRWIGKRLS